MLLAVGLSGFCAMAQNVTVVMKDGTSHKFNADHLSEITFRNVAPETPPVEFKTISINPFSGGNVTLTFTDESGQTVAETDLYGPADASWLHPGTYTLNASNDPYTIDPAYSSLKVAGQDKNFTDAQLTVTEADKVYSFALEMTLEDGSKFRGNYSGELDIYTPWIDVELSSASYNTNPQPAGDFYVKMNDANWKYEMAFVFTSDAAAQVLPAGTYTYSETRMPGTISPASYVDTYSPNANLRLAEGSKIIVTKDGDNYTMEMTLNLSDGRTATMHYAGTISGTPTFTQPEPETEVYDTISVLAYGGGNVALNFSNSEKTDVLLALDCYGTASTHYLETGVYTVGGTDGLFIDTDDAYTHLAEDGENTGVVSGKMTVTNNGAVYTFDIDIVLADNRAIKGSYTGVLGSNYSIVIEKTLSAAKYNENERPAGNFYVKFNDSDWTVDMALDIFASKSATLLPAGTYTYGTDGAAGTFGAMSYADLTSPSTSNRFTEGSTVEVTADGDNRNIKMNLKFEDGRTAILTFDGAISGTPTFEADNVVMMTSVSEKIYGYGNVEMTFSNDTEEICFDMYGSGAATSLEPGVYPVLSEEVEGFYIFTTYSHYKEGDKKVNILSGNVTVAEADGIYTIDIDVMAEGAADGDEPRQIVRRYVGKLPKYGTMIERTMTSAEYNDYASEPGKIYVKFKDSDWNTVALNTFVSADAKKLPAGTYTYSDDKSEFTFDGQSYAEIALGYGDSSFRFAEGSTVTVAENEGVYDITMELIFTTGKKATITYNGTIEGDPFPQQ